MAGGTVEGGNMKKRVVALLMAALMGVFCMTGCGNSKETTVESSAEVGEKKTQTETEERLPLMNGKKSWSTAYLTTRTTKVRQKNTMFPTTRFTVGQKAIWLTDWKA